MAQYICSEDTQIFFTDLDHTSRLSFEPGVCPALGPPFPPARNSARPIQYISACSPSHRRTHSYSHRMGRTANVPHTRRTRFPRMLLLLAPAAICTICPNSSDAWPAAPPAGSLDMRPVHCRQVTEPSAILPPRDIARRFKWLPAVQTLQRLPFLLMGMRGG